MEFLARTHILKAAYPNMCPEKGSHISMEQPKTVVIADDFEMFRQFLRAKLLDNGFRVVAEAKDGLEAVTKTAEFQPDLVLLDLSMPKLNGKEAAAQIRSIAPQSKLIFVSLHSDPEVVKATLFDGAAGYVCKSAIESDLLLAICAALDGKPFVSADLHPPALRPDWMPAPTAMREVIDRNR